MATADAAGSRLPAGRWPGRGGRRSTAGAAWGGCRRSTFADAPGAGAVRGVRGRRGGGEVHPGRPPGRSARRGPAPASLGGPRSGCDPGLLLDPARRASTTGPRPCSWPPTGRSTWPQVVRPALAAGRHVVSDRYAGSSLAYQGFGRGLAVDEVRGCPPGPPAGCGPTSWCSSTSPTARRRAPAHERPDRHRGGRRRFHRRVNDGYRALAAADPDRWVVVDGTASTPTRSRPRVEGPGRPPPDLAGPAAPRPPADGVAPSPRPAREHRHPHDRQPVSPWADVVGQAGAIRQLEAAADAPGARLPAGGPAGHGEAGAGPGLRRRAAGGGHRRRGPRPPRCAWPWPSSTPTCGWSSPRARRSARATPSARPPRHAGPGRGRPQGRRRPRLRVHGGRGGRLPAQDDRGASGVDRVRAAGHRGRARAGDDRQPLRPGRAAGPARRRRRRAAGRRGGRPRTRPRPRPRPRAATWSGPARWPPTTGWRCATGPGARCRGGSTAPAPPGRRGGGRAADDDRRGARPAAASARPPRPRRWRSRSSTFGLRGSGQARPRGPAQARGPPVPHGRAALRARHPGGGLPRRAGRRPGPPRRVVASRPHRRRRPRRWSATPTRRCCSRRCSPSSRPSADDCASEPGATPPTGEPPGGVAG